MLGVGDAWSVWWIQNGVVSERIAPGHPEQNGRHERMHKTLTHETVVPSQHAASEQQRAFDRFRHVYNDERPHEALAMKTPASRYAVSRRTMPDRPRSPEYAEGTLVRRVDATGRIAHHGTKLMLTRLFANEPVGLLPCDEDRWRAFYGPVVLGEIQWRGKQLRIERNTPEVDDEVPASR